MKIWIVNTCLPGDSKPSFPAPFSIEADAESYVDAKMRDEWGNNGPEDPETGERAPYPGDWREAQNAIKEATADSSEAWGEWEITAHELELGAVTGPYHGPSLADQLRLIRSLAGTTDKRGHQDQREAVAYVEAVTADMLAALRLARGTLLGLSDQSEREETISAIRAAIAKAEGRANG